MTNENILSLDKLLSLQNIYKDQITNAKMALDEVDQQIIEIVGLPKEGTQSVTNGDVRVSVTQNITRTVDQEKAFEAMKKLPRSVHGIFRVKYALDTKKYRNMPDDYRSIVDEAITSKTAKPSISVKTKGDK